MSCIDQLAIFEQGTIGSKIADQAVNNDRCVEAEVLTPKSVICESLPGLL